MRRSIWRFTAQWPPWERDVRTPDEVRLRQMADFFTVTVEYLRRDNRKAIRQPGQPSGIPLHVNAEFTTAQSDPPPHQTILSDPPHGGRTRYVPVFIVLPHVPDNLQRLYGEFEALLNADNANCPPGESETHR